MHMLHQIRAPQFYTDLDLQRQVLNPPVNGKIQGLFKVFEYFPGTFQDKFNFQGLFKIVLYIQVLFKPVRTLMVAQWLLRVVCLRSKGHRVRESPDALCCVLEQDTISST